MQTCVLQARKIYRVGYPRPVPPSPLRLSSPFVLALLLGGAPGCTPANSAASETCPAAGEALEDCPWAAIARASAREPSDFERLAKEVIAEVDDDAKRPDVLALWGTSLNVDEMAKKEIVNPVFLDTLTAHAHAPPREGAKTHAGVEHTYGYLFSTLPTPFGWKRARWVKPDLEQGFGLTKGALGPHPLKGTLLSNVTYLAGKIALRDDARAQATLDRHAEAAVDPSIAKVPFASLVITRLSETLAASGRTIVLRTDLVAFPRATGSAMSTHLLVYSVADSAAGGPKLVTAFPVATAFVQKTLDPTLLGSDRPIVTRYNAYVEGVTGQDPPLRGRRGADGSAPP